jgi:FdhD protein
VKLGDMPMPAGALSAPVVAYRNGVATTATDWLAEEVPVAMVFNGLSHAVMLATPLDLEDLALGFGLSEGLLAHRGELYGVEVEPAEQGINLQLEVSSACFARLKERRRNLAGRTGCGLCGSESLEQVCLPLPPLAGSLSVPSWAIARALRALRQAQALQQTTGAVHAAAWCSPEGEALLVREDIGRHNALDKLIGAMVSARQDPTQGFLCVTSRASFEMVQKAVMAGVSTLVAVSAPTELARRIADRAGLCLVGFARGDDLVIYTQPGRVELPGHALQSPHL